MLFLIQFKDIYMRTWDVLNIIMYFYYNGHNRPLWILYPKINNKYKVRCDFIYSVRVNDCTNKELIIKLLEDKIVHLLYWS